MAGETFDFGACRKFVEQNRPHLVPPPCTDTLTYVMLDPVEMMRVAVLAAWFRGPVAGQVDMLDYVASGACS